MKDWGIVLIIVLVLLALSRRGATNAETWEWVDYRGHRYCINVHREVH